MLVFVYALLHALVLETWASGDMRQFKMQRLCKTIDSPTGTVLAISQRHTNYECASSCFETFTCSCFSFQKDPGNNQGACYLYTGEVTCGTESTFSTAWSTYSFGNESFSLECETGWDKFNNSCYFLVTTGRNWPNSRDHCVSMGGVLVSIADSDENQFITDLPVTHGYGNRILWMGGHDLNTEGVWEWLSGDPWTYSNFNNGEPDGGTSENEIAMWTGGKWIDYYYTLKEFSVCEKPL